MNKKMILYVIGLIMGIESLLMIPSVIVGLIYGENVTSFLIVIAILVVGGLLLTFRKPNDDLFLAKDGYVAVALSWIVLTLFGALPFYLSGAIPSFVDAFFETVSGFTTTGSSILKDVESLDHCILFWRSFSHWVGGLGVLVFMLAIIPLAAQGKSMHLLRAESPGPTVGKLVPKIRRTATILYVIYFVLSISMVIALLLAGMPLFDSIVHMFGAAGTGGFGIWNDSIAHYNSATIEIIITVYLFMFAINFNVYYLIIMKKFKEILRNDELFVYLIICFLAVILIALNILPLYESMAQALRYSSFQVASIISTAGFSTANFDVWPQFSKMILLALMFIGGCAGSTAGGLKVSRIVLLVKGIKHEIYSLIRPRNVSNVKLYGQVIDMKTRNNTNIYLATYIFVFAFSLIVISLDGFDFATSFSSVATCLNNVGPGFALVGPTGNFADFSVISKIVLTFNMLLGRLEIFPLLMLCMPLTYKQR